MKMSCLSFILLNTLITFSCGFQSEEMDFVYSKEIAISNLISVGSSADGLVKYFGEPDSITEYYDPVIDEKPVYYYYYQKSYFEVISNEVTGFEILDDSLSLFNLKVGDSIENLARKFPNSYSGRYLVDDDNRYEVVRIGMMAETGVKDESHYIIFRIDKQVILSIKYWENT